MKRSLLYFSAAGLLFSLSLMAGAIPLFSETNDDPAVLQADHAFVQAFATADKSSLNQLLEPEFTWIAATGKSLTRAQVLESIPNVANSDLTPQVRIYVNAAVVLASRERLHVLRIWVRRGASWRAVLYQEVQQVEKSEPPAPGHDDSVDCENPCRTIPFTPKTQSEKEAIASWQGVMRAMAGNDADAYAPLIADEFTATDTHHDRPYTKADRLAQIRKQQLAGTRSTPPELIAARMFDFGDTVMMIARERRPGAKSYFNTRMWVRREGRWQMLFSFNTRIA